MKCLVVEDHPAVRQSIAALVAEVAQVATASCPGEALRLLELQPVDLLLTDFNFQGRKMTGAELIAQVRKRWPNTKTIMISAHDDLAKSLSTEIIFIAKPFDSELLLSTIVNLAKEA